MLVFDTNVLMDLHKGYLLSKAGSLPYQLIVPDVIAVEIEDLTGGELNGAELSKLGFVTNELPGKHMQEVEILRQLYVYPGTNDLFALVLARVMGAILMTKDRDLVNAADNEGIPCYGTLWLLEEMERHGIVHPVVLAQGLVHMRAASRKLPKRECEELIKRWERL